MPLQLKMVRTDYESMPDLVMPTPYEIRTYQPGDEHHWANIINRAGHLGEFDSQSVKEKLTGQPQFTPECLLFATIDEEPVATACAWRDGDSNRRQGQLHMVAVIPEHQGHRLAYWLSLEAMRKHQDWGMRRLVLFTDDFRLAAVKTYANLDWQPVYRAPGHFERWHDVYSKLGILDEAACARSLAPPTGSPDG